MTPKDMIDAKRAVEAEISKLVNEAAERFRVETGLTIYAISLDRLEVTYIASETREYLYHARLDIRLDPVD